MQYSCRDSNASHAHVSPAPTSRRCAEPSVARTQILNTRALLNLILFYTIPNNSAQLMLVFAPKVALLCVLATLISRVSIAQPAVHNGSNVQSKSLDPSVLSQTATATATVVGSQYEPGPFGQGGQGSSMGGQMGVASYRGTTSFGNSTLGRKSGLFAHGPGQSRPSYGEPGYGSETLQPGPSGANWGSHGPSPA